MCLYVNIEISAVETAPEFSGHVTGGRVLIGSYLVTSRSTFKYTNRGDPSEQQVSLGGNSFPPKPRFLRNLREVSRSRSSQIIREKTKLLLRITLYNIVIKTLGDHIKCNKTLGDNIIRNKNTRRQYYMH